MDMEKFYKEHVPKSSLPSDFGGDLPSVKELHEKHCKEFIRLRPFFLAEEKQATLLLDNCDKTCSGQELLIGNERNFNNISID